MSPSLMNKERPNISEELDYLLKNIVCEIPEKYRIVFTLIESGGLSVYETALSLDISSRTVKFRLNRAKAIFQEKLRELYSTDSIFEFDLVYCERMVKQVMEKISETDHC